MRLIPRGIADPPVEEAVERHFTIEDAYLDMGLPTFIVAPKGVGDPRRLLKGGFAQLVRELRPLGYLPKLSRRADRLHISVYRRPPSAPRRRSRNLILLAATTGTVFLDGFLRSNNPLITRVLMPGVPVYANALLFTLAIMGVFGLHELGHKAAASRAGVETTMPYFIPAPPGLGGTFGAVIAQKEPPANRDALFDLGMAGPLIGFLATILVAYVGLSLSFAVPVSELDAWRATYPEVRLESIPFPLLIELVARIAAPTRQGMALILHPVAFAAWVGCIVTFINLVPSWQLDGGHISRALLGEKLHRATSVAGVILLTLSGYYIMAILLAFFLMRGGEAGRPLDDVSPLSLSRKLLSSLYPAMMILTLVLFPL